MDFEDDGLPCGGYEGQDASIETNLQALSQQTQKQKDIPQQSCQKEKCCMKNCQKQQKKEEKVMKVKKCKKCKESQAVLVHKNDPICKQCLLKNIQYKTRLTLENHMKVKPTQKLLLCFSGGLNSICMVDIISQIEKRYQKHHLFAGVECIHIQQQNELPPNYQQIFQEQTKIKLNIVHLTNSLQNQTQSMDEVRKMFKAFPKNANTIDLLELLRDRLILEFAQKNQFDCILKAMNGETLASQIFKYFTKGIGGNIVDLCQSQESMFQYPLKQHLQKQLQYYFYDKKLNVISLKSEEDDIGELVSKEIDENLNKFISVLQDRYSHTAPAIVRTGEKVQTQLAKEKKCKWCYMRYNDDGNICRKCERLKESLKGNASDILPKWMI